MPVQPMGVSTGSGSGSGAGGAHRAVGAPTAVGPRAAASTADSSTVVAHAVSAVPGGHARGAEAVDAGDEPHEQPDAGDQREQPQDPEPGEERPDARPVGRCLHEQPPDDQRRGHVADRCEHVERREHGDPERDAEDRHQHEHRGHRADDADQRAPSERRRDPLPRGSRGLGRARQQPDEHEPEQRHRDRHREPEVHERPDDERR